MLSTARRRGAVVTIVISLVLFIHFSAINSGFKACERGNAVRSVVFNNTENAIKENKDKPNIQTTYQKNVDILIEPDGVDDDTGIVDCGHEYKYFYVIPAG